MEKGRPHLDEWRAAYRSPRHQGQGRRRTEMAARRANPGLRGKGPSCSDCRSTTTIAHIDAISLSGVSDRVSPCLYMYCVPLHNEQNASQLCTHHAYSTIAYST